MAKTSRQKTSSFASFITSTPHTRLRLHHGFTLMEVMIVIAILAGIVSLALPNMNRSNNQTKSTLREFTAITKKIHNMAKLKNQTYRLVIAMETTNTGALQQAYWVESTNKIVVLNKDRSQSFEELAEAESEADKETPYSDPDGFSLDAQFFKEPQDLPGNLVFEDVEVLGADKPLTQGKVFIHFFPSGLVEEAAIHLKLANDEDRKWTLATRPLSGKIDITSKYLSLKEIREQ